MSSWDLTQRRRGAERRGGGIEFVALWWALCRRQLQFPEIAPIKRLTPPNHSCTFVLIYQNAASLRRITPMERITATDPESRSADAVADNLARLREIFPEAFGEGGIDFDTLRQLLGDSVDDGEEKYGLNWHGKRRARRLAIIPSAGTLRPSPDESVDWDATRNLMIEGDNLEALKILQKSYFGKVKLIYIDPPYNTGKDFIYPDNYKDGIKNYLKLTGQADGNGHKLTTNPEASGRFHTNWLNMMYPRLKLARNLLRVDGLMVVSCDQAELSNLQNVLDEIFGGDNLFAILTRRAMHTVRNSSKDFNLHADYLMVYGKDKAWFGESQARYIRQPTDKTASYPIDDGDGRGPYKLDPLHARNYYRPYRHTFSNGVTWEAPEGGYPRYSRETLEKMENENRISFGNGEPKAKRYLTDVQEGKPPNTILDPDDVGFNMHGTRELRETLGADRVFPQPKPTQLITYLMQLANDPNGIVLDFFAGSGTTGHAVMSMNAQDDGNRRYILVQMPEPLDPKGNEQKTATDYLDSISKPRNIAEITKERLRRAEDAIRNDNPDYPGSLGFRVFKLDSTNVKEWDPRRRDVEQALLDHEDNIKEDRSADDLLYELLLKLGFDLCAPAESRSIAGKRVHAIDGGALVACMDAEISSADAEGLAVGISEWITDLENTDDAVVVFRDSAFDGDVAKVNVTEILRQSGVKNVRSV